jgi:hypothetical protein
VIFAGATFIEVANFWGAKFSAGCTDFSEAKFNGTRTHFDGANFSAEETSFKEARAGEVETIVWCLRGLDRSYVSKAITI